MKTPQVKPDWSTGIWIGDRTVMSDQTEVHDNAEAEEWYRKANEPHCPQCSATSRWVRLDATVQDPYAGRNGGWEAAECATCESRWNETTTATERTAQ